MTLVNLQSSSRYEPYIERPWTFDLDIDLRMYLPIRVIEITISSSKVGGPVNDLPR